MDGELTFWDVLKYCLMAIAILFVLVVGIMAITGTLGPVANQIDYNLFQTSPMHQSGVANLLTKDCTDLSKEEPGSEAYNMIEAKIRQDAENSDVDTIKMDPAVRACAHKAINDGLNNK
jgi:hypothetical protein